MLTDQWLVPPPLLEKRFLTDPCPGENVWPSQCCPRFSARHSEALGVEPECWFCRFADFRLTSPKALKVGICCYPEAQFGKRPK